MSATNTSVQLSDLVIRQQASSVIDKIQCIASIAGAVEYLLQVFKCVNPELMSVTCTEE